MVSRKYQVSEKAEAATAKQFRSAVAIAFITVALGWGVGRLSQPTPLIAPAVQAK